MVLKSCKPFRSETLSGQNTLFVTVRNFLFQSIQKDIFFYWACAKLDATKSLSIKNEQMSNKLNNYEFGIQVPNPEKFLLMTYVEVEKESEKTIR